MSRGLLFLPMMPMQATDGLLLFMAGRLDFLLSHDLPCIDSNIDGSLESAIVKFESLKIIQKRNGVIGAAALYTEPMGELPFIDDFSLLDAALHRTPLPRHNTPLSTPTL